MNSITRNPLCWPDNISRTPPHLRGRPRFEERTLAQATSFVLAEINRLNNQHWSHQDESVIISSNLRLKQDGTPHSQQSEPADTGIAVYFQLIFRRNGKRIERPIVLTCDKWCKTSFNLYAIGKDIEAQRARDRWGCTNYEQSFRGYLAIPERCGGLAWWESLKVSAGADRSTIEAAYKNLARTAHPDAGGNHDVWVRLQEAYDQAMARFR